MVKGEGAKREVRLLSWEGVSEDDSQRQSSLVLVYGLPHSTGRPGVITTLSFLGGPLTPIGNACIYDESKLKHRISFLAQRLKWTLSTK